MTVQQFSIADYGVLVAVLGISSAIGVYFAWKDRRSTNNKEFLVGNRKLQVFPVTMSMMASYLSSIALLGIPGENFVHGFQFVLSVIGATSAVILSANVFLPVFYDMEMVSVNQYLERRFKSVLLRKLASALVILQTCLYMGIVLYGPSLALGSVTGLPVWLSIVLNGVVCAFYTALGGIKAVVWTDVVQMILMVSGFLMVIIKGCIMVGGVSTVFRITKEAGIAEIFDFSLDMYKTFTFWSVVLGAGMHWILGFCTSQTITQRYCGLPSKAKARTALYINTVGISGTITLACLSGLVLFAVYQQCDPVKASVIGKYDQLMPHFVAANLNYIPGLSGLFVAAVYSGSLSTMSSGYNSLAALTWEDFLKPWVRLSPAGVLWTTKGIAAAYGLVAIVIAFLAGSISSVLQASYVLTGSVGGASGAVFFLGVLYPWCGHKAALTSLVLGIGISGWISVGSLMYPREPTPVRTVLDGCAFNYTLRTTAVKWYRTEGILKLYHIAYPWVPAVSFFTTIVAGVIIPIAVGLKNAHPVDPYLITPLVRRLYAGAKEAGANSSSTDKAEIMEGRESRNHQGNWHINLAMSSDQKNESHLSSTAL